METLLATTGVLEGVRGSITPNAVVVTEIGDFVLLRNCLKQRRLRAHSSAAEQGTHNQPPSWRKPRKDKALDATPPAHSAPFQRAVKRAENTARIPPDLAQVAVAWQHLPEVALAIRFDKLIASGEIADQAEVARLGRVSRARVTQIMNLLSLAPDIQEEILFMPRTEGGRDPVLEIMVRSIAAIPDWCKQRLMWKELLCHFAPAQPPTFASG
jgi:hypothetical protein